jgi:cyclophilin family peptidyl-prolyl cis-trans isomerase
MAMVKISNPSRNQKAVRVLLAGFTLVLVALVATIVVASASIEKAHVSHNKLAEDILGKMLPHHRSHKKNSGTTSARSSTNPHITISTQNGPITVELFPEDAPQTVANFLKLCKNNIFNHTSFYRYVAGFVLQGGLYPTSSPSTVPLEYKLPNDMWSVGLARSSDPHSGSSEYYINLADNSATLAPHGTSGGYAVFGKVVSGFEVVRAIEKYPTQQSGGTTMFIPPFPVVFNISSV